MNNNKVTVIDSIMGSGKTIWAIDEMTKTQDNFLYITPYLEEINRIRGLDEKDNPIPNAKKVEGKDIKTPENHGGGKIGNLLDLLQCQEDIASTHELFKRLTPECKRAIKDGNYILFLDETIDAIQEYTAPHKDDLKLLQDRDIIQVDTDGYVRWIYNTDDDTSYNEIRTLAENKSLIQVNSKMMIWQYPCEVFKLFKKVYIMAYLFDGSTLKSYFDINNIAYEKKTLDKGVLHPYYSQSRKRYIELINLYEGELNDIKTRKPQTALSANWFKNKSKEKEVIQLKNNIYNYFRHKTNAKSQDVMWTTYKQFKRKLQGKGYTKGFVSCNSRATNKYQDRNCLAYVVNYYQKPAITQYFEKNNVDFDQDLYALSSMLQWIWRSSIRLDKPISLYIPSYRMRNLFKNWLYEK
ncbi:MAG: hypothetical protein LUH40_00995 [Clostridiales bacterium]|nr:hypothetical protein [Clostridiales bacterium]